MATIARRTRNNPPVFPSGEFLDPEGYKPHSSIANIDASRVRTMEFLRDAVADFTARKLTIDSTGAVPFFATA